MNANITFPSEHLLIWIVSLPKQYLKIQQATGLNPSESFYLGFEIISSIEQGILQGERLFCTSPKTACLLFNVILRIAYFH